MPFPVVTIRSGEDADDDALYPDLAEESAGRVTALTVTDGQPAPFVASGLKVTRILNGKGVTVVEVSDVKIEVDVTDTRLMLGCRKYDKGGGWGGFGAGALVAVAANGVSKMAAARRRRGKALVGQVRYGWLAEVGASPKQGWLDSNELRLVVREADDDGGALVALTLTLPKSVDPLAISREVIRRAARWRLENDLAVTDTGRLSLQELAQAPLLSPQPKAFSMYSMPTAYRACPETAYGPLGALPVQGDPAADAPAGATP